jgi:hypothetical protein
VIYAATASTDPAFPQAVAVIDPASATVTASTPLAGGPGALAVSGDGAYLYAGQDANGTVSRLSLPALATDLTLTLPTDSLVNGPLRALDIEVAPGNAHEVAIAVGRPPAYTPNCHSLMLLQDAQLLAELPGNGWDTAPCVGSIQWGATSSVLYTDDIGAFPGNLYRVAVDAHGMSSSVMVRGSDFLYMGPIQYRSGLLYTAGGAVYDPVGGTLLGQLPKPVNALLRGVFSPETHRVIAVDEFVQGLDGIRITALDTNTFTELAHIDLPGLHAQVWSGIRWGADGYALALTDGRVLLLNGAFVGP